MKEFKRAKHEMNVVNTAKKKGIKAVRMYASTHYKEHFRSKINGTQDTTINYEQDRARVSNVLI